MNIRPHHLLCIRSYVGRGYSEEFTANMDKITAELKSGAPFTLVKGKDDLCAHCPYCTDECMTKEKTDRYDKAVLDALKLEYGKEYVYKIPDLNIDDICSDCEWFTLCKKVTEKIPAC